MAERRDLYRIFLRGMTIEARVGVHRFEREKAQRLLLDVTLFARREGEPQADRLAAVLNYERVARAVRAVFAGTHINLLETAAERVAAACLAEPKVQGVLVSLAKPDIFPDVAAVGVEIERWKEAAPVVEDSEA
jgi:7,8-dihydroneopterin aldolase/epimerase/oxygenase